MIDAVLGVPGVTRITRRARRSPRAIEQFSAVGVSLALEHSRQFGKLVGAAGAPASPPSHAPPAPVQSRRASSENHATIDLAALNGEVHLAGPL